MWNFPQPRRRRRRRRRLFPLLQRLSARLTSTSRPLSNARRRDKFLPRNTEGLQQALGTVCVCVCVVVSIVLHTWVTLWSANPSLLGPKLGLDTVYVW